MKRLFPLLLALSLTGCDGLFTEVGSESLTEKQRHITGVETDKKINGYPNLSLSIVCVRGILYYQTPSYYGYFNYVPAISSKTLQPELCNGKQE